MNLPQWIEPKITVGNILTIIALLGAAFAAAQAYGAMGEKVDQHSTDIVSLRQVDAELRASDADIVDTADADRLFVRETLAELRTDMGYVRRWVEGEKRVVQQR